jgi:polynucleotide 5'-hydroxyl-kinase GRC3/NOL9
LKALDIISKKVPMEISPQWQRIDLTGLSGTFMVIGAPDTGKSTFCRYLFARLRANAVPTAYLDGDTGQSGLGPPATLTVAFAAQGEGAIQPDRFTFRTFVGNTSPVGQMLPLLVGAARLKELAMQAGVTCVVYDTCGFIDPRRGTYLRLAEIDLLRPCRLFALQRSQEIEHLLIPLRRSRRVEIIELAPPAAARTRSIALRRAQRAARFRDHFQNARTLSLDPSKPAVLPFAAFDRHRLVGLEDARGLLLGLAIIESWEEKERRLNLFTPVQNSDAVDCIRLGTIQIDPVTFQDAPAALR